MLKSQTAGGDSGGGQREAAERKQLEPAMVLIGGYEDSLKRLGVQSWQSTDGAAPSYHFDMLQVSAPAAPQPEQRAAGCGRAAEEMHVGEGGVSCRTRSATRHTGRGSRRQ